MDERSAAPSVESRLTWREPTLRRIDALDAAIIKHTIRHDGLHLS